MHEKSRLRQSISQWASHARYEAHDLQRDSVAAGMVPLAEAPDRERVTVQGTLRTVTLRPRGGVPALEAELYDGSGVLVVLWLGRRRIAGIRPGRVIRVEGRIGVHENTRIIYNPHYDLIA